MDTQFLDAGDRQDLNQWIGYATNDSDLYLLNDFIGYPSSHSVELLKRWQSADPGDRDNLLAFIAAQPHASAPSNQVAKIQRASRRFRKLVQKREKVAQHVLAFPLHLSAALGAARFPSALQLWQRLSHTGLGFSAPMATLSSVQGMTFSSLEPPPPIAVISAANPAVTILEVTNTRVIAKPDEFLAEGAGKPEILELLNLQPISDHQTQPPSSTFIRQLEATLARQSDVSSNPIAAPASPEVSESYPIAGKTNFYVADAPKIDLGRAAPSPTEIPPATPNPEQPIWPIDPPKSEITRWDGSGGQKSFEVVDDGKSHTYIIENFGMLGLGSNPSLEVRQALDSIQFVGNSFTADNLCLQQRGRDLVITFKGRELIEVILKDRKLEDLDNLSNQPVTGIDPAWGIGNILFNRDRVIRDWFDVMESDSGTPKLIIRDLDAKPEINGKLSVKGLSVTQSQQSEEKQLADQVVQTVVQDQTLNRNTSLISAPNDRWVRLDRELEVGTWSNPIEMTQQTSNALIPEQFDRTFSYLGSVRSAPDRRVSTLDVFDRPPTSTQGMATSSTVWTQSSPSSEGLLASGRSIEKSAFDDPGS